MFDPQNVSDLFSVHMLSNTCKSCACSRFSLASPSNIKRDAQWTDEGLLEIINLIGLLTLGGFALQPIYKYCRFKRAAFLQITSVNK